MTGLSALRARQSTWGRFVSGVVVLAWISVMLQPCVMAMSAVSDSISNPTMHEMHRQPSHQSKESDRSADVSYEKEACNFVLMTDCETLSVSDNDGRNQVPKLKDAGWLIAAACPSAQHYYLAATVSVPPPHFDRPLFSSGPPLNIRFCVYLK